MLPAADFTEPAREIAVLLKAGENDEAAMAFLAVPKSPEAREIIEKVRPAPPSLAQACCGVI